MLTDREWSAVLLEFWGSLDLGEGPHPPHHPLCDFEVVLHELAHMALLGVKMVPNLGKADEDMHFISAALADKPVYQKDLNEVRTIAVEVLVAKRMRISLSETRLVWGGTQSTIMDFSKRRFMRACRRAQNTVQVRVAASKLAGVLLLYGLEHLRAVRRIRESWRREDG